MIIGFFVGYIVIAVIFIAFIHGEQWNIGFSAGWDAHKNHTGKNGEKMAIDEQALTWDELCKLHMIGEPVWNSHTRRWMLIIDSASDGTWVDLVNHAGGKEHWMWYDLRKNPLYRKEKK